MKNPTAYVDVQIGSNTSRHITYELYHQQAKCEDAMLQWLLTHTPGRYAGYVDYPVHAKPLVESIVIATTTLFHLLHYYYIFFTLP